MFVVSFTIIGMQESFANYDIAIRLDKTCEALIAAGDTETCPSIDEIRQLFPQVQLNEEYANLIESEQDKADIISNNNQIKIHTKSCVVYDQCSIFDINPIHTTNIWYNLSEFVSRSTDTITITPHMKIKNPVHLKYNDVTIITNDNKRQITFEINQLYVTPNCKDAIFSPGDDWQYELGHLIYYMQQNCTVPKLLTHVFDMHHIEETEVSDFDPLTSPNYLYRLQLQEDIARCKTKC